VITCGNCGGENPAGKRFCGDCGAGLEATCASCGATNPPGKRFCGDCGAALADVPAPAPIGRETPATERRLVSILFADLVGFTTLSESRDAEDIRELLSRYFDTCRRLIALYGGTVEKFIGDAVMAVWGTPQATEDDAERAVRAALDLVAAVSALGDEIGVPDLRARAGVLTGDAVVNLGVEGEGMVAGDLVNTASRVQSVADPGSVLVGEATRRASEQTIVFEEAGERDLKGKSEPITLWRALRVVSGVRGQLKSGALEAPFVGRDRELRQVKDLFHASAGERKAQLVSVTGIAGIGKSRLAWEFYKYFDGIVETVWWHRGRCLAYGEGVTYWALADMVRMRCRIAEDDPQERALEKLRSTLGEVMLDESERRIVEPRLAQLLGCAPAEDADRQQLFAAWRLFFERLADSNPTVLVFEDLQWADESLLDFIEYLLEWSRNHPLFIVTLARPELLEKRATWGAGLRAFTSIYLEPLTEEAMTSLLTGLVPGLPADLRDDILARAEGIPLYAVETVRMLLDRHVLAEQGAVYEVVGEIGSLEVPETLQALIAARLDGLGESERSLVQDAAVLGKTFTVESLGAVSGSGRAGLEPLLGGLVRKEVLFLQVDPRSPEQGQYGFLQDLVRRVAYETLARRDRKARHLAAAEHLAATLGDDEVPEVIASHLVSAYEAVPDAGDAKDLRARAGEMFVRAGERAASLAAAAEARRYFEHAAEISDDEAAKSQLIDRAGRMALRAADTDGAWVLFETARDAYLQQGDAVAAALVDAQLADIDFRQGHPPRAVERTEAALEAVSGGGSPEDVASVAGQLGRFLIFAGEYERAAPYLEQALSLAEALALSETFVQTLNSKGVLMLRQRRPLEARVLLEGALATALKHDLSTAALRAYNNLIATLWTAEEWSRAGELLEQARALARRVGNRDWEVAFTAGAIGLHYMLGRWDEAVACAEEVDQVGAVEFVRGLMLYVVRVHCNRGQVERARELMTRHADIASSENPDFAAGYAECDAIVLDAEGRPNEALAGVKRAFAQYATDGPPPWLQFVAFDSSESRRDPEAVREIIDVVETSAVHTLPRSVRAQRARFRARLPEHDALAELSTAERIFRDFGAPFYVAVTQLETAERLAAAGRHDEAAPRLAEAREIFARLGAVPWLERCEKRLEPSATA